MECDTMSTFLPPDASNMVSSFFLNLCICSGSLWHRNQEEIST
jgi:hypothetical protein